uniref:fumarate reductase (NADH) n=1 Tax=Romanomermis culicivorax TaxID=13658 RepID=A0A915J4C7_ROMCU
MKTLFAKLDDYSARNEKENRKDWIRILTRTRAEELLMSDKDPNRVVGVKIRTAKGRSEDLKADAVILACGGFCNDHSKQDSLLTQYRPDLTKYPSTNGDFADGSGIKMALKLGADVVGMNRVQCHPTGFVDPKDPKSKTKRMCPEALRGFGGILVNNEGHRFANELDLRENFVTLIEKNCKVDPNCGFKTAYLIVNDEIVENFGRSSFDIYLKAGLVRTAANLKELSKMIGIPYKNLKSTFDDQDQCFRCEKSDDFGKTIFPVQFDVNQIFYFCQTTPSIHYTFGGLKVDESCRVLTSADHRPIHGLYAVGETAGGTHGAERLSGNSLLECVVFGRLAAQEAIKN